MSGDMFTNLVDNEDEPKEKRLTWKELDEIKFKRYSQNCPYYNTMDFIIEPECELRSNRSCVIENCGFWYWKGK
jgi:hypothetical protein